MNKRKEKIAENAARSAGRLAAMRGDGLYYSGPYAWAYMDEARKVAERKAELAAYRKAQDEEWDRIDKAGAR